MNKENKPRLDDGEVIGYVSFRNGDLHTEPLPVESPNVQEGKDVQELSEELFDKYGYYVDDNLSAMEMVTGRSIILQNDFMSACKDVAQWQSQHSYTEADKWISVSNNCVPENENWMRVCLNGEPSVIPCSYCDGRWFEYGSYASYIPPVSHWKEFNDTIPTK